MSDKLSRIRLGELVGKLPLALWLTITRTLMAIE